MSDLNYQQWHCDHGVSSGDGLAADRRGSDTDDIESDNIKN